MLSWTRLLPYPFSLFVDVSGDGRKYALLPPIINPPHNPLHFALSPLTSYGHARRTLLRQFVRADALLRTRIQLSHTAATDAFGDVVCQFDLPSANAAPIGHIALRVTPTGTAASFAQLNMTSQPPTAILHAAHTVAVANGTTAGGFVRGNFAHLISHGPGSALTDAHIPAAERYGNKDRAPDAVIGVRIDNADSSAGIGVSPVGAASAWIATSYPPASPHKAIAAGLSVSMSDPRPSLQSASIDASLYYRPETTAPVLPEGDVTGPVSEFGIEVIDNGAAVIASYYHHAIVRRRVYNPLEERGVIAIHNYIDVGAEYVVSGGQSPVWRFVGAWQMNKNVLVKAAISHADAAAALVVKSWWSPSVTAALTVVHDFLSAGGHSRVGVQVDVCDFSAAIFGREPAAHEYRRTVSSQRHDVTAIARVDPDY